MRPSNWEKDERVHVEEREKQDFISYTMKKYVKGQYTEVVYGILY